MKPQDMQLPEDMKLFRAQFGMRVRNRRLELGISQDRLAEMIGITTQNRRSTISKIESGKQSATNIQVIQLAEALETTVPFLMDRGNGSKELLLSPEETELVRLYRKADKNSRDVIWTALERYQEDTDLSVG